MMKKMVVFIVFILIVCSNLNAENGIVSEVINTKNVPFWDGETDAVPDGALINRYGGPIIEHGTNITHTTTIAHSGKGSYHVYLKPTSDFFQLALSGFGSTDKYIMTRDINIFQGLSFWMKNDTGVAFTLKIEIKDYRDDNKNILYQLLPISKNSEWIKYDIQFAEMIPVGTIDLTQARFIGFVFQAPSGVSLQGNVYIDDTVMIESGDSLNPETADFKTIVEQIARRQFLSLWGARNRTNGLLPLNTTYADVAALNVTACLVKLLPSGVKQCFITQKEADDYMEILLKTLKLLMDKAKYLPPRYVDWVSIVPNSKKEESPIDAAFIALALYQYKELPTTSAELKASIDTILSRFNFKAFGSSDPAGWKLAYQYTEELKELPDGKYEGSFTVGTYDGYSTEIYLISLIAAILDQVDITQYWNTGIKREKDYLASCKLAHVVHSDLNYRAPFLQWLFPLFVNLNSFGADTYPDLTLRVNPLQNAINYQKDMNLELKTRGRELFLQPDAGDDGTGDNYKQFSCYLNDESKNYLFMPWSVTLSLFVDDGIAEPALRNHLRNNLHSPFGLSDSASQSTGTTSPEKITARHDLWNTGLSTIAMFSYLFSDNLFLTNLPKVKYVLKEVLNSYNSYKIFTKNESCEFIINCGEYVKVFGAGNNTITVESGGKIECVNFIGTNVINIKDSASGFTVRRSGATVYLENLSTGTFIKIPATKTDQTINFADGCRNLVICNSEVNLGNQKITKDKAQLTPY